MDEEGSRGSVRSHPDPTKHDSRSPTPITRRETADVITDVTNANEKAVTNEKAIANEKSVAKEN